MWAYLNRFMTTEQVKEKYQIPDDIAAKVLANLPVAHLGKDGIVYHLECEVDQFLADLFRSFRRSSKAPQGKPGRKTETFEIAEYANELRRKGKTWDQVLGACKRRWPNDAHVKNIDQVRATHRRHFGERAN